MDDNGKLNKLLTTGRGPQEIQDWLFSLAPLGVAFAFFLVFVWAMDVPDKDVIIVIGAAAGFIGLESYWVFRGWRRNHLVTILLGLAGIALAIVAVWLYAGHAWRA